MASGTQHLYHNLIIAGATTTIAYQYNLPLEPVIIANLAGIILTPDLDMESKTYNEIIVAKILARISTLFLAKKKTLFFISKFYAAIIMTLTAPYAFIFPHRSWLTHLPPFSVIIQLAYFYLVYYCIFKLLGLNYTSLFEVINNYNSYITYNNIIIFSILCIHHFTHLIGDGGMILFFGKKRYLFGYWFYSLSRKMFPQGVKD